eukprot:Em0007g926a
MNEVLTLLLLCIGLVSAKQLFVAQDGTDRVLQYDIFIPRITSKDDSKPYPKEMTVDVVTTQHQFKLILQQNQLLMPSSFTSVHYDATGNEVITKGHPNCFYHGVVEGHMEWMAFMSTCNGLSGSFGDHSNKSLLYHIKPYDQNQLITEKHVIHLGSDEQEYNASCGTPHDPSMGLETLLVDKIGGEERLRRQSAGKYLYVELIMVNDISQYKANSMNLSRTILRALQVANTADGLYKPLGIRIVLIQTITWNSGDKISVVSNPSQLLDNFRTYRPQITTPHDVAMLFTGISIDQPTVGIAYVSQMCSAYSSVGVIEDIGGAVTSVGAILAHELGHLFSMQHDTDSCICATSTSCIMSAVLSNTPPTRWSSCSTSYLNTGLTTTSIGSCLGNVPTMSAGSPICGNGIREGNETCDCGTVQECNDPCCNAANCTLAKGAQCASGACCSKCQFVSYGTQCRAASGECDIAEYCGGRSSDCPPDRRVQDGTSCSKGVGYCYSGSCPTVDSQCKYFYGSTGAAGYASCFNNYNTRGDLHGNCGSTSTLGTYTPCSASQVLCGSLQCANTGSATPSNIDGAGSIQYGTHGTTSQTCKSFVFVPSGVKGPDVWLVSDGTKCDTNKICYSKQCVAVSSLGIIPCPLGKNGLSCSGNGLCNDLGQCSCNVGYGGFVCNTTATYSAVTETSGGFAIGGGIALTVFVIVVAAVAYFAFKRIKKRQGRNAVPKEDQSAMRLDTTQWELMTESTQ